MYVKRVLSNPMGLKGTRVEPKMGLLLLPLLLLAACVPPPASAQDLTGDQLLDFNSIANEAGTIPSVSDLSSILMFSPGPFCAAAEASTGRCFIAATRFGKGRLVQFTHEKVLEMYNDMPTLLMNTAAWACNNMKRAAIGYNQDPSTQLTEFLVAQDAKGSYTNAGEVDLKNLSISKVQLLILNGQDEAIGRNAEALRQFIEAGGGVMIAAQAWYWAYSQPIAGHPNNLLTSAMGFVLTGDSLESDFTFAVNAPPSQISNAAVAVQCVADSCLGKTTSTCYTTDKGKLAGMMQSLTQAAAFAPTGSSVIKALASYATTYAKGGLDPSKPVAIRSPDALGIIARTALYKSLPANQVPTAPDAKFFPGMPPAGTRPLGSTRVKVKGTTTASYWQGLGLWAMAGKPVTVVLPRALLKLPQDSAPITLHIGGWTDEIYRERDEFTRMPELVRFYTVKSTRTVISSAFGGLIYITLPEGMKLPDQTITVTGAIKAPVITEGMTAKQWAAVLASSPAPWGEVVTSKLVISTPRTSLATVKDPVKLVKYWNAVMDSQAWMAGIDANRPAPMRFQHDQDISAGYMHSGYPIMTFMDVVNSTLDINGDHWGHYHELGHNHQEASWTWECVGEVTCNFFSAYGMSVVRGFKDPSNFYGWFWDAPNQRREDREKYFADGPNHKVLCDSPSLYLDSFLQVVEDGGYGFELLRDTIASYKQLSDEQVPETDEEKIQRWVIQQSKVAGCSFYGYYKSWGWPVLDATRAELADLPVYPNCGK